MRVFFKQLSMAAAITALASGTAMAAVGGGGATLPAHAYHGDAAAATSTGDRLSVSTNVGAAGSLFKQAKPTLTSRYCQVGSGSGRAVLTSASGNTDDTRNCPNTFADAFVNGTSGFSAQRVDADFAASDAPASGTDFTTYVTNEGVEHQQMTQFPALFGLIAVIYNNADVGAGPLYLTEAELCNVFAGHLTNWNQLVKANGTPYPSKAIKVVYRSDSSGTSFGFSNHLNWVCQDPALAQTLAPGASPLPFTGVNNFTVQSTFATAFPGGVAPVGSIGSSGNPGVVGSVDATDGAIGYAEAANVISLGSPNVKAASIAAVDTAAELNPAAPSTARVTAKYTSPTVHPATFAVPATYTDKNGVKYDSVFLDSALGSNDPTYGRPTGAGRTQLTAAQVPTAKCAFVVLPGAFAKSAYKFGGVTAGYKSYPIGAITYLLGNYKGNAVAGTADVRAILGSPFKTAATFRNSVTTVGANTGYQYLSGVSGRPKSGSGTKTTLNTTRVNTCTID